MIQPARRCRPFRRAIRLRPWSGSGALGIALSLVMLAAATARADDEAPPAGAPAPPAASPSPESVPPGTPGPSGATAPAAPYPPYASPPYAYPPSYPPYPAYSPYGWPAGAVASPPIAFPSGPDPGERRHDGFCLHLALGGGGMILAPGPGSPFSGAGVGLDVWIGGALTPHLVLLGAVTESFSGVSTTGVASGQRFTALTAGVGPALIYYTSSNFYLGGTIAMGLAEIARAHDATQSWQTGPGLALAVEIGREWWVSPNWGLGVGVRAQYLRSKEDQAGPFPPVWTATTFDLLMAATYN